MLTADLAAYSLSRPEALKPRFITLHDAPDTHPQRVIKMRNLKRSLAKDSIAWEAAWSAEPYRRSGVHLHAVIHGPQVGTDHLTSRIARTWGGSVHVSDIPKSRTVPSSRYLVKTFASSRQQALELNGGRALHTTAGFHHGLTRREAAREMRAHRNAGEVLAWHLEPHLLT